NSGPQIGMLQLASVNKTPARPAAPEITGNAGIGHAATVASNGMQHIAALVADHLIERRSESSHGNNPKKKPGRTGQESDGRNSNLQKRKSPAGGWASGCRDRKSTRLNSSHVKTSYAVFCLKKKKHD